MDPHSLYAELDPDSVYILNADSCEDPVADQGQGQGIAYQI